MNIFDYQAFSTRNIGFLSQKEQIKIKKSSVFLPGAGGMGGTTLACLARMGFEHFIIADMDTFELSNFNRQMFANLDTIGVAKTAAAKTALLKINPNISIDIYDDNWVTQLDQILPNVNIVINGCDDIRATVQLLRKCQTYGLTCIDAFASTLPNVYVVRPNDPRPEEWLDFPTLAIDYEQITTEMQSLALQQEIIYVSSNTPSMTYIDGKIVKEMLQGKRKRPSFAPMVWMTSCLMCYEATKVILNKKTTVTYKGAFFDPYTFQIHNLA